MRLWIPVLAFAFSFSAQAAQQTTYGYAAFKTIQAFVLGTNNWGKSTSGNCRFDFQLLGRDDGAESLQAELSFDAPEGSIDFKDTIGYIDIEALLKGNTLVLSGGSYDGDATLTLQKRNGQIVVKAHWEDHELGPDRNGFCVLPALKK